MDKLSEFCEIMSEAPESELDSKTAKKFKKIAKYKQWNRKRLALYELRDEIVHGGLGSNFVVSSISTALKMKKDKNGKVTIPTN